MSDQTIDKIDQSLALFLSRVRKEYKMHLMPPILFESIREFVLREGKRIRPTLMIYSYKGYRKEKHRISPSIYYVSTCIELLHNFMLIHDDIIDRSDLRRGKPTMHRLLAKAVKTIHHEKLGLDLSIVAGDIVYALAIDAFLSNNEEPRRKEEALKYFIKTTIFTAMGEFIDTVFGIQNVEQIKEKDVLLNYSLKTASYTFDCPLVIGAILAGADKRDVSLLADLGLLTGQAFQIQDDIIGIFDSQKNIGKSILSDLTECKKTMLVCHAYQTMSKDQRKIFTRHFNKPQKTYANLVAIRRLFIQTGSLLYSIREVKKRLEKSKLILRELQIRPKYRRLIETSLLKLFTPAEKIAGQYAIK